MAAENLGKLIEEDIQSLLKDQAATLWCEKAINLTDSNWRYLKVPQQEFENLHPENFEELCISFDH